MALNRPAVTPVALQGNISSSSKVLSQLSSDESKQNTIATRHRRSCAHLLYDSIAFVCTNPVSTGAWNTLGRVVRFANTTQRLQDYTERATRARFPNVAYLKENQWNNVSSVDGYGTAKAFKLAADVALKTEDGRAIFNIGGQTALLTINPGDIAQIFYHNSNNISRDAVFEAFKEFYHHNSVFAIRKGDAHTTKRRTLTSWLFAEGQLKELTQPMQEVIDEFIETEIKSTLSAEKETASEKKSNAHKTDIKDQEVDLGELCTKITMDLIARTRLGTRSLAAHSKTFGEAYESAFTEMISIENITRIKLANMARYCFVKLKIEKVESAKQKVLHVIREHLLKPNSDLINNTDNLLKAVYEEEKQLTNNPTLDLNSDEMVAQIAFLLLGGHETTSRLLQFALMSLYAHPEKLALLRKEISDYQAKNHNRSWSRDDMAKLPYLEKILNETLRKFSPAPATARGVDNSFTLAYLDRFDDPKSSDEYYKKLNDPKRDRSRDIKLSSGRFMPDLIIVPQFAVHEWEKNYYKPEEFIPERFDPTREDLRPKGQKQIDNAIFLPFGSGGPFGRECPGQRIALQEVSLALLKIVPNFDMKLPENVRYPFPVVHRGTIKSPEPVKVRFTHRSASPLEVDHEQTRRMTL